MASTALRAYRNRHLGTLMHWCQAWEPVGKCFDQCSFECINFHRLSQIAASLTRERIADREAEIRNLPWTQTEKDNALAKCRLGLRPWRTKKPMLCLHAVTDEDGHPLENEDESGRRLCEYWCTILQARNEGERHHCYKTILRYVLKAPGDNSSTGVPDAWVRSLSTTRTNMCLLVALSLCHLMKAELYSFPSPPTLTAMVVLRSPQQFVEAFIGIP